jgi:hypothetical protein
VSRLRSFYVYRIDALDGTPVYIGKGSGRRYLQRYWGMRNASISGLIKDGLTLPAVCVADGLTEAEVLISTEN